jgi:hypothetical protein
MSDVPMIEPDTGEILDEHERDEWHRSTDRRSNALHWLAKMRRQLTGEKEAHE